MLPQVQSLGVHLSPSILPRTNLFRSSVSLSEPFYGTRHIQLKSNPRLRFSIQPLKCSVSVASGPTHLQLTNHEIKPFPAEVTRTIMELSSVGTLSSLTREGWPLGIGVRFAVDSQGTPVLILNESNRNLFVDSRSSFHVQLEQCGLRTPQCSILGILERPSDQMSLKKLQSVWKKKFGEEVEEDFMYIVSVERILHMEDFGEDGVWVTSTDYKVSNPDPLRNFAEKLVGEINANSAEDVFRFCNIYADLDFQVLDAKMVWVDRLGFDIRVTSTQNDVFEVRIPFPREVTDEKGAKSSFNGMSQLAWEVEKNFQVPDFKKVKQVKKIVCRGLTKSKQ